MSKYNALWDHVAKSNEDTILLTFTEIGGYFRRAY